MKTCYMVTLAILLQATATFAQEDTINAVNSKLLTGNLKEGTNVYLVYFTDSNFARTSTGDIWERTTAFNTTNVENWMAALFKTLTIIALIKAQPHKKGSN